MRADGAPRSAWDAFQPHDVDRWGPIILDHDEQVRWSQAIFLGGLTYMWRRAHAIRELVYSTLDLAPGHRVLVVGEVIEGCGFADDLRERVGPDGEVRVVELVEEARSAYFENRVGRGGQLATWQWDYTADIPDGFFDAVTVLQGVQHTDDWTETATEFARILRPGRPVVLAEIAFGPRFAERARSDVHLDYLVEKVFDRMGFHHSEMPYYSADMLHAAIDGVLVGTDDFEWRGVELFWGHSPDD
jgi:SAM-dependent methyltransferase